jgi:hypothetical protein
MADLDPIIILGMHRSGTTMLTQSLIHMGFFAGREYGKNLEDFYFQRRNEWFLRRCGGTWDNPLSAKSVTSNENLCQKVSEMFAEDLDGFSFRAHKKKIAGGASWGWKDPRSIFSLPVWLKVFPNAKLLYIKRNGVDVASSLNVRAIADEEKLWTNSTPAKMRIQNLFFRYERFVLGRSLRCLELNEAFKLWEEYTAEAEHLFETFEGVKLEMRYEDLLTNPIKHLSSAVRFCGLPEDENSIALWASNLDPKRKYAFTNSPEGVRFYEGVKGSALMEKLGYEKII